MCIRDRLKSQEADSPQVPGSRLAIVQTTRVREPFSYYLAFYRRAVLGHTLPVTAHPVSPPELNISFLEWNPPNLQSNLMLHPNRARVVESGTWPRYVADDSKSNDRDATLDLSSFGDADYAALMKMLGEMDVVGTSNRFAEFAVFVKQLTGVTPHYRQEPLDEHWIPNSWTDGEHDGWVGAHCAASRLL